MFQPVKSAGCGASCSLRCISLAPIIFGGRTFLRYRSKYGAARAPLEIVAIGGFL